MNYITKINRSEIISIFFLIASLLLSIYVPYRSQIELFSNHKVAKKAQLI